MDTVPSDASVIVISLGHLTYGYDPAGRLGAFTEGSTTRAGGDLRAARRLEAHPAVGAGAPDGEVGMSGTKSRGLRASVIGAVQVAEFGNADGYLGQVREDALRDLNPLGVRREAREKGPGSSEPAPHLSVRLEEDASGHADVVVRPKGPPARGARLGDIARDDRGPFAPEPDALASSDRRHVLIPRVGGESLNHPVASGFGGLAPGTRVAGRPDE